MFYAVEQTMAHILSYYRLIYACAIDCLHKSFVFIGLRKITSGYKLDVYGDSMMSANF